MATGATSSAPLLVASADPFNNLIVHVRTAPLDDDARLALLAFLREQSESAARDGKNAMRVLLHGAGCAAVDLLRDDGYTVRGWVNDAANAHLDAYKWLKPDVASIMPPLVSARVGVCVVLVHADRKHALLVKERFGPTRGKYKWVTGSVGVNETPFDAVAKEVREETGVEVRDVRLLAVHIDATALIGTASDHCYVVAATWGRAGAHDHDDDVATTMRVQEAEITSVRSVPLGVLDKDGDGDGDVSVTAYTRALWREWAEVVLTGGGGGASTVRRGPKALVSYACAARSAND